MNKKPVCGLLTAAVVFGAFPVSALAYDDLTPITKSLDFREADNDIIDPDLGYEWDAGSRTLTLEDFRITVPAGKLENAAAIYLPEDSTIELEGEDNVIETLAYRCDAISCEGELWFEEDGKLEIITKSKGSDAIYAEHGPIVFTDEVELKVDPAGHIIYVKNARGSDPIISFRKDAKLSFHEDEASDDAILVTHKSSVTPGDNWLDFAEERDDWEDEYFNLIAVDKAKADKPSKDEKPSKDDATPPAAEEPSEEPAKQSTYEITIGNVAIKKDGYVTYISDAKPYLSHGYTMLPLRALLNVTDADVDVMWDAATKTVSVSKNTDSQYSKNAVIPVGESYFVCGSERIALSTPAELTEGRAFVSLRDWMNILSALDMSASDLNWDSKTKTVTFVH